MKVLKRLSFIYFLCISVTAFSSVKFYAHRGGRALWPENTLYSYQQVLDLNVDFVDMDIQLSKDGMFMVTHDSSLNLDITKDLAGDWILKSIPVNQLTVKQLQQYDIGSIKPNTSYSKLFPNQTSIANLHMPTLVETIKFVKLHAHRKIGFQIEAKIQQNQLNDLKFHKLYARKIYNVLKENSIIDVTEIQSFDFVILKELSKLDSNLKLAYLTDEKYDLALWSGQARYNKNKSIPEFIDSIGGHIWEPSSKGAKLQDINTAHKLGMKVVIWGLPPGQDHE